MAVKAWNVVNGRARCISRLAWLATIVLAIPATIVTFSVQPLVSASFFSRPWGVIFPLIALGGLIGMGYFNFMQRDMPAFLSSGAFILALLTSSGFSLHPDLLPAVNPANSLTIYNASASQYAHTVGFVCGLIGIVLAC